MTAYRLASRLGLALSLSGVLLTWLASAGWVPVHVASGCFALSLGCSVYKARVEERLKKRAVETLKVVSDGIHDAIIGALKAAAESAQTPATEHRPSDYVPPRRTFPGDDTIH